jgi:hypothetical protein
MKEYRLCSPLFRILPALVIEDEEAFVGAAVGRLPQLDDKNPGLCG